MSMGICLTLNSSDINEIELCYLLESEGYPVDVGIAHIDYAPPYANPTIIGTNDGEISRSELLRAAIIIPESNEQIENQLQTMLGATLPWWPSSFTTIRWQHWIESKTIEIGEEYEISSPEFNRSLATGIFNWMTSSRESGGLGIQYRLHHEPEANADEVLSRGYATCTEFLYTYYGIATLAGLEVYPLEIPFEQADNNIVHMGLVISLGNNQQLFIDPERGINDYSFYPTHFIGDTTSLFAAYLRGISTEQVDDNRILREISGDPGLPIQYVADVAPNSAMANYSLSYYRYKESRFSQAINFAQRAISLWNNFDAAKIMLRFLER